MNSKKNTLYLSVIRVEIKGPGGAPSLPDLAKWGPISKGYYIIAALSLKPDIHRWTNISMYRVASLLKS